MKETTTQVPISLSAVILHDLGTWPGRRFCKTRRHGASNCVTPGWESRNHVYKSDDLGTGKKVSKPMTYHDAKLVRSAQ